MIFPALKPIRFNHIMIRLLFSALALSVTTGWGAPPKVVEYQPPESRTNSWAVEVGYNSDSSPALAPEGTIYCGSWRGKFFAISPEGQVKWIFDTKTEIKSSPAIAPDGTVYIGCRNKSLYALSPEGKLKWTFQTGAWVDSSPAIAANGTVYFGSWDKTFYALNPDGSVKWTFKTDGEISGSAAVASDGTIYFGSHDKNFYALDPAGAKKWAFKTGGPIISSPAIASDGAILFTSTDGKLYLLNMDGSLRWKRTTGGITESSPVIDVDGAIRLGINENYAALTATGGIACIRGSIGMVDATPALDVNHLMYLGGRRDAFNAFWPNTEFKIDRLHSVWDMWTSGLSSSPVISPAGMVYFTGVDGKLTAVKGDVPLAKSSWPMFCGNPRHTGNVADNGK